MSTAPTTTRSPCCGTRRRAWSRSTSATRPSASPAARLPGSAAWPSLSSAHLGEHEKPRGRTLPPEGASGARRTLGVITEKINDTGSSVQVTLTDGSHAEYSVVVVAEGIRSTTRAEVFGPFQPRPVGQMYWRTAVPEAVVDLLTMVA